MADPVLLFGPMVPETVTAQLWTAQGVTENTWQVMPEQPAPPARGNVLVPLERWRAERAVLVESHLRLGVVLDPGQRLEAADGVERLDVVALRFPKFTDGRAYSTARVLREQLNFKGEIRAVGDVLVDQIPLMRACGFTSFEIVDAAALRFLKASGLPRAAQPYRRSR